MWALAVSKRLKPGSRRPWWYRKGDAVTRSRSWETIQPRGYPWAADDEGNLEGEVVWVGDDMAEAVDLAGEDVALARIVDVGCGVDEAGQADVGEGGLGPFVIQAGEQAAGFRPGDDRGSRRRAGGGAGGGIETGRGE
jgi:hypothetical protein